MTVSRPDLGYLYILSNPSMQGVLKIGSSERGGYHRARELYAGATGVPAPFHLEFEVMARNPAIRERRVHDQLARFRVSGSREFFRVELAEAVDAALKEVGASWKSTRAEVGRERTTEASKPRGARSTAVGQSAIQAMRAALGRRP